jgi:PIN domain nuclease of toxin-antitoxin system
MKLLLDTHLLLWVAENSPRLSQIARDLVGDPQNHLMFSAASLCEITIKNGLGRGDFKVDAANYVAAY